jgi:hypothetical protein
MHEYHIEEFTRHINSIDPNIKFTTEQEVGCKLAFLDACVNLNDDGTIKTTVYGKATHTDQYLLFASNHHLQHQRLVVRSLTHRVGKIVMEEADQKAGKAHVESVLTDNGYPPWMFQAPKPKPPKTNDKDTSTTRYRSFPIPYIQGVSCQSCQNRQEIRCTHLL